MALSKTQVTDINTISVSALNAAEHIYCVQIMFAPNYVDVRVAINENSNSNIKKE